MGKTRNHKKKIVKGKKKIGRTRKGGYWLYPTEDDKESNFGKLFTFNASKPAEVPEPVVSTPKDMEMNDTPAVEVKGVDTPAPSEVPSDTSPEPAPESEPEASPDDQSGGKKRKHRKKRAGDYSEADFAKMYGTTSSSHGKKRGSKEGEQAIAPFMGGDKMFSEEEFKKMYGNTKASLESSVKKGDKEAEKYLKGFIGGQECDSPPCLNGGKRRTRKRKGSKKKHHKKKTRKTKKAKKSKKVKRKMR